MPPATVRLRRLESGRIIIVDDEKLQVRLPRQSKHSASGTKRLLPRAGTLGRGLGWA